MSIFNRRDFLSWAKRCSLLPFVARASAFAVPQATPPPTIPTPPPVIGPGTNDSTWELNRQAQQRMSDYVQQTLRDYEQNRNNYAISQGAELRASQSKPYSLYTPQLLWDEGPEGALHEDFPQAPNQFNPETGRFYDNEGNEFNPD